MNRAKKLLSVVLVLSLASGCAGPAALKPQASSDMPPAIKDLLPPSKGSTEPDRHIRRGVLLLQARKYAAASKEFNSALRFDPQNAYYQFFNGLAYHLLAEQGDSSMYDQAQIGYELALKFDPTLWIAAQQLGRLYLSRNQYARSQNYFAQALLQRPGEPELLNGLAQASYHAGDIQTALGAVKKARQLDPSSAAIMATEALILAAAGHAEEARKDLADYRSAEKGSAKVALLKEQLDDWDQLRDAPNDAPSASTDTASAAAAPATSTDTASAAAAPATSTDTASAAAAPPPGAPQAPAQPDMVMIDVVMIRTENQETTNKGVNLLQGLQLQFGGTATWEQKRAATLPVNAVTSDLSGTFTAPSVTYNMNIFNAAGSHNEIIARPTLIAMNGKKSEFFSGDSVDVALQGTQSATSHTIDAGVNMSVTPTMQADGRVALELDASRSFFEATPAGTFTQAVSTSKNTLAVNVVMNYDQTLIVNALREKQTTETKSGVPFLRDIPIIQYLFSNVTTLDFHKSILILLTPRHMETGVDTSDPNLTHDQRVGDSLKKFQETYPDLFHYDINASHALGHLMKHSVWLGLTKSRTFDVKWYGQPDALNTMIQRDLSFLYY